MGVNSQYFTKEQVESGEMAAFIEHLAKLSYSENSEYRNDILVQAEDMGAFYVNWIQVPWDKSFGGSFEYVDSDEGQVVGYEQEFPDGSFRIFYDKQEAEEALEQFLKDNPNYHKTSFGRWSYIPEDEDTECENCTLEEDEN